MEDFLGIMQEGNITDKLRFIQDQKIGRGINYPVEIDDSKYLKDIKKVSGISVINQSLYIILNTRVGERFFLPEFGTKLHRYIFDKNTYVVKDKVREEVLRCVKMWEKRIDEVKVTVEDDTSETSRLKVIIYYHVKNTNETGSFVMPISNEIYSFGKEVTNETVGK